MGSLLHIAHLLSGKFDIVDGDINSLDINFLVLVTSMRGNINIKNSFETKL
jgi:hypothetical protein